MKGVTIHQSATPLIRSQTLSVHHQTPIARLNYPKMGKSIGLILSAEVRQAGAPAYGQLVTNNDGVFPFAPTGKFIMFMRQLPSNYPIKHLKTNDDYAYLYQPKYALDGETVVLA